MKYRIYIAFLLGIGFATLVLLILMALGSNLLVAMVGIGLLMPGIGSLQVIFHNCCESRLPMLAVNGLIYSAVAFLGLVWPVTARVPRERLKRLARSFTYVVVGAVAVGWGGSPSAGVGVVRAF